MRSVIAIAAHPDDIELMMAGTLLQLKKIGYEIHYLNLSSGNLGTISHDTETIKEIRLKEAKHAASVLGAVFHAPFCNDLEIMYDVQTLRQLSGIIRMVKPSIILTHGPDDYMEDHINTGRLAVTAAFARGMTNFDTDPTKAAPMYDCTIYHSLPHTLKDQLRRTIIPASFVNTTSVHSVKMDALKAHQSQHHWLDTSQKMNSYLQAMEDISLAVGKMSGKFTHAEGWRRHLHVGFGGPDEDPLMELGNDYLINHAFEKNL